MSKRGNHANMNHVVDLNGKAAAGEPPQRHTHMEVIDYSICIAIEPTLLLLWRTS